MADSPARLGKEVYDGTRANQESDVSVGQFDSDSHSCTY